MQCEKLLTCAPSENDSDHGYLMVLLQMEDSKIQKVFMNIYNSLNAW